MDISWIKIFRFEFGKKKPTPLDVGWSKKTEGFENLGNWLRRSFPSGQHMLNDRF